MSILYQNITRLLRSSEEASVRLAVAIRYSCASVFRKKFGTLNKEKILKSLFEAGEEEDDKCNRLTNGVNCEGTIQRSRNHYYHLGGTSNRNEEEYHYCDKCEWTGDYFKPYYD